MIVLEHIFIRLQIELRVILSVLPEADRPIFVDNSANFDHVTCRQLAVIFVSNDFDFLAYKSRLLVTNEKFTYVPSLSL